MIGDTIHDALAASEVGMDFIGVTWGLGLNQMNIIIILLV